MRRSCVFAVLLIGVGSFSTGGGIARAAEPDAAPARARLSSFILPHFCGAIIVHPQRILESKVMAPFKLDELVLPGLIAQYSESRCSRSPSRCSRISK